MMRISVVSPDLSSNAMARTCPIAQTLSRNHDVEFLGFRGRGGIFGPYRDAFEYTAFDGGRTPLGLYRAINRLQREISGDVVYAFRPLAGSLGAALLHKRRTGTPVILDVEDYVRWSEYGVLRKLYNAVVFSGSPTAGAYSPMLERKLDAVDGITVTSSALRERYGGTILPYGPDASEFNPDSVAPHPELQSRYPDTKLLVFIGTIRHHKGLDVLADAMRLLDGPVRLVIAGYDPHDQLPELRHRSGDLIDFEGPIPHDEVPSYLASADIVPIPQRETRYTKAQIPQKIFEAMSMGKPIVASSVSDLLDILGDAGLIVEPGRPEDLAQAIDQLLMDPEMATQLGRRARERYVREYSRDALLKRLEGVLNSVRD